MDSPVAVNDYYWTPADTDLVVSAPGILANDYDPGGSRLEAWHLVGNEYLTYGTLLIDAFGDGSFTYKPYSGVNGRDTFTYWCVDEDTFYTEATVTIDVGVFNRAPHVADPMEDINGTQGNPDKVIDLDTVFDDVDIPVGDQLTYSVTVSPPIMPVVNQVSQSSYQHFLDDMLYTHLGDSRGYASQQHNLARNNIHDHFQSLGLTTSLDVITEVEDVVGGTFQFNPPLVNVVGVKTGVTYPDNIYIVGAHYDSVSNPGADDNASGVAAVMEMARVLAPYSFDCTLHFVAFDGEEDGLWGSMHYAEFHTEGQVLGMISVDMIAYNQTGEGRDVVSIFDTDNEGPIKTSLVSAFADYGGGLIGEDAGALDASDHAPFEWFGYDSALVIESAMANEPFANEHYHQSTDAVETPDYIDYTYATKITGAVTGYLAQSAGVLGTVDVLDASIAGSLLTIDFDPAKSGGAVVTVRATDEEGLFVEDSFSITIDATNGSQVVARHIFYNNSYFDGDDPAANANDDNAIAPAPATASDPWLGKTALRGGTASFQNYTSYSRGINGIMIDIQTLADPDELNVADFQFRVGTDDTPDDWPLAPAPLELDVRTVNGLDHVRTVNGLDRVTIVWADGAIKNQWLQVTVLATGNTGLSEPDVHYWGNAVGESGNSETNTWVNAIDRAAVRDNPHNFLNRAPIDDFVDFNRDSYANAIDRAAVRDNATNFLTSLKLITLPSAATSAIQKEWLQVTVLATPQPGLAQADVFFFGNAVGESGNDPANSQVNLAGFAAARDNPHNSPDRAAVDYDYNRNSLIDAVDMAIARDHQTDHRTALQLIDLGYMFESLGLPLGDGDLWAAEIVWFNKLYGASNDSHDQGVLRERAMDAVFAAYYEE